MMSWIAQGLEKVVPHPNLKSTESPAAERRPAAAALPAAESQEGKSSQVQTADSQHPSMIQWIKQGIVKVVPQPEVCLQTEVKPATQAPASKPEPAPAPKPEPAPAPKPEPAPAPKTEPAPAPKPEPAPAPKAGPAPALDTELKGATDPEKKLSSREAEHQPHVIGWITRGIERMLPQPVNKLDATGSDAVQSLSIIQKKADLVLEDVSQEKDTQQKVQKKEVQGEEKEVIQTHPSCPNQGETPGEPKVMEAGPTLSAHMEERLQQERLEAARIAEEMARKAAAEAVRQLEVEHSAKIVIETLPDANEQLPNILEEENEDEPELQRLQEDSEGGAECRRPEEMKGSEDKPEECLVDVCPAEVERLEEVMPSSTDVEPASERRDLESPVSQQGAGDAAGGTGEGVPGVRPLLQRFRLLFPAELVRCCRDLTQRCSMNITRCIRHHKSNSQNPQQP